MIALPNPTANTAHITMTRKQFFIQVLDQFSTTGNDLLQLLDDIESGEIVCFLKD